MLLEMLQDCAGAVEGSVGPWTWERQQWVVPQHPLTDVTLLFKSKQRNTSFSVQAVLFHCAAHYRDKWVYSSPQHCPMCCG